MATLYDDLLSAAGRVADDVLWPAALDIDRATTIPDGHYDAVAELGLFSMLAPVHLGGQGLDREQVRGVLRVLGGGCGATAFAFAQHGGVVAALAETDNAPLRDAWLARLCKRTLGGTAFAHVRRAGAAALTARRVGDGWRVDGFAPWATSWGTAEAFTVAATTADDEIVWFLLTVDNGVPSSIEASTAMELVTFEATETVSLRFVDHPVAEADVLSVGQAARWRVGDRRGAVRPNPLCVGIGDRALRELHAGAPETAASVEGWWRSFSEQVMNAQVMVGDTIDEESEIARVADARSSAVFATQQLTTALLAASGGRGADRNHVAQLLARQSLFYVIQAQNDDGRAATLRRAVDTSVVDASMSVDD